MVELEERPDHRRASHDRASPSVELPCRDAAPPPATQISMSARRRRDSACPIKPTRSAHPLAQCSVCGGSRTGTSPCWTRCADGVGHKRAVHSATNAIQHDPRFLGDDVDHQAGPGRRSAPTGPPSGGRASLMRPAPKVEFRSSRARQRSLFHLSKSLSVKFEVGLAESRCAERNPPFFSQMRPTL